MPRQIAPDADNPHATFTEELENLVMEAQNAGVDHADISQALRDEAKAVEYDEPITRLFE
jgi:hypothetical protein